MEGHQKKMSVQQYELLKYVSGAVLTWSNCNFVNVEFNPERLWICAISAFSNSYN